VSRHLGPRIKDPVTGGTDTRRRARGMEVIGMVYAIEPQYVGPRSPRAPLKLGYTRDAESLARRVVNLQTALWLDLHIAWSAPGFRVTEKEIHERCAEYRIRGEWFYNLPGVWEVLREIGERYAPAPARRVVGAW
jgi:hypothetical protein